MRVRHLILIVGLVACSVQTAKAAVFNFQNQNFSASPVPNPSAVQQCTFTPLDTLRSTCMQLTGDERAGVRTHHLDKRVLAYLRQMVRFCRYSRRRDIEWYYQAGWEFAATHLYGPLPPRIEYSLQGVNIVEGERLPEQVKTQPPAGWRDLPLGKYPLRKIAKRFSVPWSGNVFTYETLECAHILMSAPGYSVPVQSRRCVHCAISAALSKKKPATSSSIVKAKAVGA